MRDCSVADSQLEGFDLEDHVAVAVEDWNLIYIYISAGRLACSLTHFCSFTSCL